MFPFCSFKKEESRWLPRRSGGFVIRLPTRAEGFRSLARGLDHGSEGRKFFRKGPAGSRLVENGKSSIDFQFKLFRHFAKDAFVVG